MTEKPPENTAKTGLIAAVLAYGWWGALLPVFLIALRGTAPEEVLAHRVLWSVPFGAAIIAFRSQWPEVVSALRNLRVVMALAGSSAMIAINWLIYIIAVDNRNLFEAALGYYINPLVYVLVGVVVLREKLSRGKQLAVLLAAIGVTVLTFYGGKFPAVALVLAVTFTAYGYLRKQTPVGAMPGLFIETLLLSPFALVYLLWVDPSKLAFGDGAGITAMLVAAGPVTVFPLLCFAIAARRLSLSTLGFMQFIGPTLQFVVGLIDGEDFSRPHQICFAFIWTAAAVFALDAIRQGQVRRRERRERAAGHLEGERGERRPA
ncbi:EamA family transporter RarD [Parvularcula maris]|uniref:EamA family transporter RarD n=1 Tax=Parvularcula maris TaxID=2965077 RepID=A0A9X2L6W1_9PROT|nr:EamA family transporter RarD [Parvularcula maris]MCQ8184145.1 EamA family transporter RarD [Parvularcula maris]